MTDRAQLEQTIAALEAQRAILGDAVADAALTSLREKLAALQPPAAEQRKLATVLFADVSGFTALSETLDAEDISAIMNALWARLDAVVHAHGGRIDKHIGDALMALWGADQAREDDPEQAVRAALALQRELAAFRAERGLTLAMRIGVNTGPVLLGVIGSTHEFTAMGDAVNLASRLEHAAPVGEVLISHDTFRHIRGLFDVQPQPPLVVKGKHDPVQTYVVAAARSRTFRMPTRGVEGIATRTIGRDSELIALQEAYRDATEGGETRLLTVVGDAGVGKSRLLSELERWVDQQPEPIWLLRGRATVEALRRSGELLRDLLSSRYEVRDTDSPDVVRAKLTAGLAPALDANQAAVLAQAAGFDFSAVPAVQAAIGSAGFSDMAAAYLATYLRGRTESGPVLLLLEDLHWADDRSLDLLDAALVQLPARRLLVVGMARPALFERRPNWSAGQAHSAQLELRPLSARASRELVGEILQRAAEVPEALRETVVRQAEGNPFYIEELIKMLLEQGVIVRGGDDATPWVVQAERLGEVTVPPTLAGVLQARLDSLPAREKATLQRASVVGRAFWDAAVAALAADDGGDEIAALDGLRTRELVFRRERSAFAEAQEYVFKHALLREVTYESVLKRLRRGYHRRAAQWLERAAGARAEEYAALIADHYALAEDQAAEGIWQARAGKQATAQHAHDEALRRLDRALELLPVDAHAERYDILLAHEQVHDLRGERDAQVADLTALEGLAALGDTHRQVDVTLLWSIYYEATSDFPAAIEAARRAQAMGNTAQQAAALLWWGRTLWRQGHLAEAQAQLEPALELALAARDQRIEMEVREYLGVVARDQGHYPAARAAVEQAHVTVRAIGPPHGEARARDRHGVVASMQGDYPAARAALEQSLATFRAIGDREDEAIVRHNLGFVASIQGDESAARAAYAQNVTTHRAMGHRHGEAYALDGLGHALTALGQPAEAVAVFTEAVALRNEFRQAHLLAESRAGLACALQVQGDMPAALAQVEQVLTHLSTGSLHGAYAPMRAYLCCIKVLQAAGDARALPLLERAHSELQEQAARMDETSRRMFLEQVPHNRALMAAWAQHGERRT